MSGSSSSVKVIQPSSNEIRYRVICASLVSRRPPRAASSPLRRTAAFGFDTLPRKCFRRAKRNRDGCGPETPILLKPTPDSDLIYAYLAVYPATARVRWTPRTDVVSVASICGEATNEAGPIRMGGGIVPSAARAAIGCSGGRSGCIDSGWIREPTIVRDQAVHSLPGTIGGAQHMRHVRAARRVRGFADVDDHECQQQHAVARLGEHRRARRDGWTPELSDQPRPDQRTAAGFCFRKRHLRR